MIKIDSRDYNITRVMTLNSIIIIHFQNNKTIVYFNNIVII